MTKKDSPRKPIGEAHYKWTMWRISVGIWFEDHTKITVALLSLMIAIVATLCIIFIWQFIVYIMSGINSPY